MTFLASKRYEFAHPALPRSSQRCGPGGIQSYQFGEYRTAQAILEIYSETAQAICTGNIYQIRVDLPPGPPTNANGSFAALPFWPAGTHDLLTGQCIFIRHIDLKLVTLSLEEHVRERIGIRSTIKSADGPGDLGS